MDDGKKLVGYEGMLTLGMGSSSICGLIRLPSGIASSSPSKPIVRVADALRIFVILGGEITFKPSSHGNSLQS